VQRHTGQLAHLSTPKGRQTVARPRSHRLPHGHRHRRRSHAAARRAFEAEAWARRPRGRGAQPFRVIALARPICRYRPHTRSAS